MTDRSPENDSTSIPAPASSPPVSAEDVAAELPIITDLKRRFGAFVEEAAIVDNRPTFVVKREQMTAFAAEVKAHGYDYPACVTGVDWPDSKDPEKSHHEAVYHLRNMQNGEWLVLKARCPATDPWLNTLCHVYRGVDWHEREIYDLIGIVFQGHPDLRRILMPEDWTGHPLQKSYRMSTFYSPAGNERQK